MSTEALLNPSLLWLLPLLGLLTVRALPAGESGTTRRVAVAWNVIVLGLAMFIFLQDDAQHAFARADDLRIALPLGLSYHVGVDGLSALLLPTTAAISLCVLLAAPRAELTPRSLSQSLLALSSIMGALVSLDAMLLVLFWILSLLPLGIELGRTGNRRAKAAYSVLLIGGSLPMLLFLIGLALPGVVQIPAGGPGRFDLIALAQPGVLARGTTTTVLGGLLLASALVRIGCFPLHIWIAPLAECGLGTLSMVSFSTPLGLFLVVRVLMPVFPELCGQVFPFLLPLGLLTALYGAVVALGQHDLRRALGFFWISQQGFLLSGLSSLTAEGTSGALLHAVETVIVRTGLLLLAAAIVARVGTTDVRFLGGFVARAPRMASAFLLLSAAAIGLPGTTGFVSEDLIVKGLLRAHAVAATVLLVVTALNGILLFRLFQRVFLGAPSPHHGALQLREFTDLRRRERWVSVCLIGLLLLGGLVAAPLLAVRKSVVTELSTAIVGSGDHDN